MSLRDYLFHEEPGATLYLGDCVEVMASLSESSVDAVVTDPPYGLEFMGKAWDSFGGEGRFASVGIGQRERPWPTYGGLQTFGAANPTCGTCGGRARGAKLCACEEPEWRVKGQPVVAGDARRGTMAAYQDWTLTWATAALRVLKPGAHLLAFGGTRTFHRLTCALEDAGFEIRDCLMWLYGSGFPKSLDVSKAIDKAAGAERAIVGTRRANTGMQGGNFGNHDSPNRGEQRLIPLAPNAATAAAAWSGWGTALKPAWEPIVLARKPLSEANVAANMLQHGVGSINVDGCRIDGEPDRPQIVKSVTHADTAGTNTYGRGISPPSRQIKRDRDGEATAQTRYTDRGGTDFALTPGPRGGDAKGRWPANLVLDEEAARQLDEQSGKLSSGFMAAGTIRSQRTSVALGKMTDNACSRDTFADSGGASRFFYTSKAGRDDRDGSKHPTVKPLDLCKWLVTLVTRPGGIVLDPFMGSGTIVFAARQLGLTGWGVERETEYAEDARRRLRQGVLPLPMGPS